MTRSFSGMISFTVLRVVIMVETSSKYSAIVFVPLVIVWRRYAIEKYESEKLMHSVLRGPSTGLKHLCRIGRVSEPWER